MRKTSSSVKSAARSKQFSPARQRLLFALLTFSSLTSGAALAGGVLPTGGHFVGGAGAITTKGNGLTVNQSTQTGIINWQSFSIGKGNSVNINNGNGATLNRVTGGDVSVIAGSLKSTGSVYVVNTAGVLVTPTGKVITAGSFVASTRDVSDGSFAAGGAVDLHGDSAGTVVNQGSITSANGDVVLVGKSVANSGAIKAAKGTATLAAGDDVLLQAGGEDTVLVKAGSGDVTNTGTVAAAQVALNAAGGNVYALAVNDGGVIRATGTATKDGHVYLTAGDDLTVNSNVAASNADGTGGTIVATGKAVVVGAKAKVTADGATGDGGTILIGGKGHLGATRAAAAGLATTAVDSATMTDVAAGAQISANAGANGNGGSVVVWSNQKTDYTGKISAKGGANTGNGGFVEVSAEGKLGFTGKVTTMAAHGAVGELLLDPSDVTIYASTDTNIATFNNTANATFILNTTIDSMLASNDVTISTTSSGTAAGDIHFGTNGNAFTNAAPIFWSSSHSLTLQASGVIDTPGGNPNSSTGGFNTNTGDASILINSRGGGTINFNAAGGVAGGGALGAASTVITLTGDFLGSGGAINFTSTGATYRIEVGNGVNITNTAALGAGTVTFTADQVRLGTLTGPTGKVTTPGEVDIVPTSSGAVKIGDIDPNGQFANNDNTTLFRSEDVLNVNANVLVIGSTATTSISLVTVDPNAEFTQGGINTFDAMFVHSLKFLTGVGGSVTQDANTPIVVDDANGTFSAGIGGLAVQTTGAIKLDNPYNSVGTIAFQQTGTTGGAISFTKEGDQNFGGTTLTVGTVAGVSGITAVGTNTVTLSINETNVNPISGSGVTQNVGAQQVLQATGAANAITATKLDLETDSNLSSFALDNTSNAFTNVAASAGAVSLHDNISLTTATVGSSSGITAATGDVTIVDNGKLTIGSGAGISAFGNIRTEDQTFQNNDAGAAFTLTGTGKTWRVYSQDPTQDSDNGAALTYGFVQYNAANSYADPFTTANAALDSHISATSNGFIYSVAPVLKETVSGLFNKVYDGTNVFTGSLTAGNYAVTSGFAGINSDQISFTNPTGTGSGTATYAQSNAGNNIAIGLTVNPTFSAKDTQNVTVFGYQFTPTVTLKGNITPLDVTVSGSRIYDGTVTAAGSILTVAGTLNGDTFTVTGSGSAADANVGTNKTLTSLGTLGLSGTGNGNYHIASGTLTITPKDVTVSGTRTYDGTTTAAGSDLSVVGEIVGDPTLTVTGSGTVGNANVGNNKNVTLGTLGLSGTCNGNYNLVSGTLTITPKSVTISGTRTYDGTSTAAGSDLTTVSGTLNGDTFTVTGSGTVGNANVGNNKNVTLGTLALSGTGNGNYSIASGTLTITPKAVTISGTRAYDGTTTAAGSDLTTVSGTLNGDTFTVTGSGTVGSANVGNNKNVTLGTLALSGTGNGNYSIASGTLTITPKSVTISGTRTYDGTSTAAGSDLTTVSGTLNGDTFTVTGSGTVGNANVGNNKNVTLGTLALSGTGNGNYSIASGTLTITPKAVTISGTRTYDGTTTAAGSVLTTVSGTLNGDTFTVTGSGTVGSANVGNNKPLTSLGTLALSGTGNGNYSIASGTLTITPKAVTISGTRTYDGTTTAAGSDLTTVSGTLNGDTFTVTGSGTVGSANVGNNKNVTLGTLALSGTGNGNYSIASGTLTITPKAVTISGTRTYDGTTTAAGSDLTTVSGTLNGDTFTVTGSGTVGNANVGNNKNVTLGTLALSGTGNGNYSIASGTLTITPKDVTVSGTRMYDGTTTAAGSVLTTVSGTLNGDTFTVTGSGNVGNANVGTNKTLTSLGTLALSGTGNGNYHIASGTLTITPADVTIVGFNGTRVYDGLTDANSSILTLTNIASGDVVTLTGTGVLANKNVGKETITGIGTLALGGADASNYQIVVGRPDTYVIVTKANLTVSAVTQTKVFDGTVTSTGTPTVVGLKTGDSIIGTLMQAYGLKDVLGTNKSTLSVTNYTGVNDGNGGGNYNVTVKTAKGTITPENIVISAVSQTKVYDGTTTSTETPLLTDGTLYNGDMLTGLAQAYQSKNVLGTNKSTLVVDPGYILTHAGNYDVTVKTAKGTITPLAIVATGTRVYNDTTDVDGNILKILNGIPGDEIGLTGTGISGSKHVGTHDVTGPGTLALTGGDAGNYTLTGGMETVKITPYSVILYGTRVYDGATDGDSGILAVTNAFAGDSVDVATGTSTIISRNVGNEKITDFGTLTLGGASSGDYTLVGAKGVVKVTPELLTVTAVPDDKTYDGTETSDKKPIVTTGTVFGPDTGDFIQTYGSPHAGHNITLTPTGTVDDGNGGNNYIVTYVPVTTGVIDPRPVILTGTRPIDNQTDAVSPILSITNLVPGDSVTVTGNGVLKAPNVGPQPIIDFTGLTLGGPSDGDYTLVGAIGVVTITPLDSPPPPVIPNTQTASGTAANVAYDGGLIKFAPRQNGIVTGTIATIDGTDYQPDSQLGCTLGAAGCIQNGVAPTTSSAPQQ